MKRIASFDVADVLDDPGAFFSHPDDVLGAEQLSDRDKHMILDHWLAHTESRDSAMAGEAGSAEPGLRAAIADALDRLDQAA